MTVRIDYLTVLFSYLTVLIGYLTVIISYPTVIIGYLTVSTANRFQHVKRHRMHACHVPAQLLGLHKGDVAQRTFHARALLLDRHLRGVQVTSVVNMIRIRFVKMAGPE